MAANPYGLDLPGDFDEDTAANQRRRLQLVAAMKTPIGQAGSGWGGALANFLQNSIGSAQLQGLDASDKELAGRRAAFAEQAMADLGKLDTPAVPAQIGTGPIAPPPGTPGVEPYGGGATPMNTPEPGPDAPAAAFSATQAPPDTPAGWVGAGGGGMIPQGAEFKANAAGAPMIPGSMADKLKLISRMAQGGPIYAKVAEKVMTQQLEAPEKEAARKEAAADRSANLAATLQQRRDAATAANDLRRDLAADSDMRIRQLSADSDRRTRELSADSDARIRQLAIDRATGTGNAAALSGDFSQTGDAFLASLDPQDVAVVKKIASGEIPLTNFSTRGGHREALAKQAAAYDPSFNAVTRPASWREFTTGPTARNITSINTSISHMGTMLDLADALQNNDIRVVNAVVNRISTELGNPEVTNYATARQAVGEELMRTFRVVGASEHEAQAWQDRFKDSNSPAQLRGALTTAGKLLNGRIEALDDQWKRGTQSKTGFPGLIPPENEAVLARIGVKRAAPAAANTAPATAPPSPAASAGAPKRISNKAEYDALQPNETYVGPDGVSRVKK